jgi:hypothetical protein
MNFYNITQYDTLKENLIVAFTTLLSDFENDIESGINEGIYLEKDNVDNRVFIKNAKMILSDFKQYCPRVYMYTEGGQIQGMSATENVVMLKFDDDDYKASTEPYLDGMTPETWDTMITGRTLSGEIKPVY